MHLLRLNAGGRQVAQTGNRKGMAERKHGTDRQQKKHNNKITKYRKPLNINIGMIIFGVVFIYVVICVILYFQTSHIVRYEVQEGSLVTNNIYRGVVIRDETVITTGTAGYVNYYAREGERVAKNDLVYIVDETGRLNEDLQTMALGENTLSKRDLAEFRDEIVAFVHGFDYKDFDDTYDFKYSLQNMLMKLANANMLANAGKLGGNNSSNIVNYAYAPRTGVVAYWTDGYEDLTAQQITMEIFNEKEYKKEQLLSNTLMAPGVPAYKLSTSENWSIVFPVEPERGEKLLEEGYIRVKFLKNQYEAWGQANLLTNSDGNTYLQLSFTNSMVTFLSDRFLDVELIVEDEKGLKIPVSAIVQKEFFLIPEDYVILNGSSGRGSIMKQCYLEDGTISSEMLEIDLYNFDDETREYYLDSSILDAGNILYKLDSQETFTVSRRATLIGVYNINRGYADFKQINILYQNEEYAIVKSNTRYGLSVYDYIVQDASTVSDDQFIKQ